MKVVNGPLLRQLRQARGLHFLALSAAVDVDRRSLSSYEKSNPPNVDLIALIKLAEFYGRTVDDLLIEEDELAAHVEGGASEQVAAPCAQVAS